MKKNAKAWSTAMFAVIIGAGAYSAFHDRLMNSGDSGGASPSIVAAKDSHRMVRQVESREPRIHQTASRQPSRFTPERASELSLPANTQTSGNWAGYIDEPVTQSAGYTSVSGNWTVPAIQGSEQSLAAQWIGLGGVSTQSLLQTGTIEQEENGQTVATVFWEKLPATAQNVMTVPVGSTINASIFQSTGSKWEVEFTAHTPAGKTLSKTIAVSLDSSYAGQIGTSAEWISEDPSNASGQLYPLANAGTVKFSQAQVNHSPLKSTKNKTGPIALTDGAGNVLIAPSDIGADGASFSTTTVRTAAQTAPSDSYSHQGQQGMRPHGWPQRQGWGTQAQIGYGNLGISDGHQSRHFVRVDIWG